MVLRKMFAGYCCEKCTDISGEKLGLVLGESLNLRRVLQPLVHQVMLYGFGDFNHRLARFLLKKHATCCSTVHC